MYRQLDPNRIVETCALVERRIEERFPGSGLGRVAHELHAVAQLAGETGTWLARPMRAIRILVGIGVAGLLAIVMMALTATQVDFSNTGFSDTVQGVEALINDAVFVGIAIYFLLGIETRLKRRRALRQLHELRSLAHIVDMHQLTKDPERIAGKINIAGPPPTKRPMTPFMLTRYLDYASELLALISMISAIYVQRFDDAQTMEAASDIEALTVGLSRKIWQKITIVERDIDPARPETSAWITPPARELQVE